MWFEQQRRSVLSLQLFDRQDFTELFRTADYLRGLGRDERAEIWRHRTIATLFFEPSTRTRLSFEAAAQLIGGSYISLGHPDMTKASVGESLEDTLRVMDGYADTIVIRHPRDDAAIVADDLCGVPIINAGCGTQEHPTQALVDLYAMHVAFGTVDGLTIGIMGDLHTQRTINSLILGLSQYTVRLYFISHPDRRLLPTTLSHLRGKGDYSETDTLTDVLSALDVLYVIRIPRAHTQGDLDYERLRGARRVAALDLNAAKPDLIILNPLPRHDEVDPTVDSTKHAYYFKQAHLGRYLRAALLVRMFDDNE